MRLLLIAFLITQSLAYNIKCVGDITAYSIYEFANLDNSYVLAVGGEMENGNIYGEMDTVNVETAYYDETSPVCGGEGSDNILYLAYCHHSVSGCWDVKLGQGQVNLLASENGVYYNNVITVNSYPCMSKDVTNFSFGLYDWNNDNDIGIANANFSNRYIEGTETPTEEEAEQQRNYCKEKPKPDLKPLIDNWESLLNQQNQNLNNSFYANSIDLSSLDTTLNDLNSSIEDLKKKDTFIVEDSFKVNPIIDEDIDLFINEIYSLLPQSFNNYSSVFGFGGYGSKPNPITFSMLGKSYSAFDISTFDEQIPFIRTTFSSFAYVWGIILVFRTIL